MTLSYFNELKRSMEWLSTQSSTIFLGQAVSVPGTAMFNTLKDIDPSLRHEMPVFEDTQLGMSIGLSLAGFKVVSVFPRWNFLVCAANQLVNHLDKYPVISEGQFCPQLIIRTSVGSERPLHPGHQHIGDMTRGFQQLLSSVDIIKLEEPNQVLPAYQHAYQRNDGKSTILVEYGDFYNEK
jgi:pyruvate/2-oxoglutarate/acetoin dehydrogenase E1 component